MNHCKLTAVVHHMVPMVEGKRISILKFTVCNTEKVPNPITEDLDVFETWVSCTWYNPPEAILSQFKPRSVVHLEGRVYVDFFGRRNDSIGRGLCMVVERGHWRSDRPVRSDPSTNEQTD